MRAILAALCAVGALAAAGAGPALAAPTLVVESPANGSFTSNTTPSLSGTSTDTLDQVTVDIYKGNAAEGTIIQAPTATPAPLSGSWSVTATTLSDGTYTAVAEQVELGLATRSAPVTFTVKTVPPLVTLSPVASPTSDPTPTIEGEAGGAPGDEPAVKVIVYEGGSVGGGVASTGAASLSGKEWTYKPSPLPDGTYTAQATQRDGAGNTGTSTPPQTFTVKTAVPGVTLKPVLPPTSNNAEPTLEGTAGTAAGDEPTVAVKIYVGESATGTVAAMGSVAVSGKEWTFSSAHLADGTYTAQASQRDSAGNTGKSTPQTFTIDTVKPVVTLEPIPSPSNNAAPMLEGAAGTAKGDLHEVTVTVYEGPTAGGPVAIKGSVGVSGGSWTYTLKKNLADGTYTARATQSDTAKNEGESAPQTFTVKATKPIVSLNPPEALSSNATPAFSGKADTGPGNIPSVTLKVFAGEEASGKALRTATVSAGGGQWETGPIERLSDGTYTAQAEQKDQAGNTGFSAPATFTVHTAPPAVSLNHLTSPTKDATPTLEGKKDTSSIANPSVLVTVYSGGAPEGTVVASETVATGSATWSYTTPHLSDGTYTARAEQTDKIGNTGKSSPVTFTVDTKNPTVSLNEVPSPSKDATPTLSGGAGTEPGDSPTVHITIYEGPSASGHVVVSATAPRSGGGWSYTSPHLGDGTYTALAVQEDEAGNVGTSAPQTFTINTASPTVTLASPAPLSNNTTPSFNGSASDTTPVTVTLYHGAAPTGPVVWKATSAVVGGSWSSEPVSPPLVDGQYTAIATQPSSLGNPEGKSAPATFKISTAAPTVTLAQPPSPSNNLSPSFTGTASDSTTVTIKLYEGTQPTGTLVWEATATPAGEAWTSGPVKPALPTGTHTYTAIASQKSSLGNHEGTSVPATFTVETTAPTVTLTPQLKARSNNPNPAFSGTATDTSAVTVNIYKGKAAKGAVVTTATGVPAAGAWTSGPTAARLADGEYTAQATQPSSIGNPEGKSGSVTFIIDAKPPAVTLTPLHPRINTPGPELTGQVGTETGDVQKVLVKIYKGSAVGGEVATEGEATIKATGKVTTWSFKSSKPPNLADGTYTAQATQEDEAANIGASAPVTFTIDTIAPTVILDPVPVRSNNRAPSFTGTSSEMTTVTIAIYNASGNEISKATASGTGAAWSSGPASPELPNVKGPNEYTAAATQTDEAGNTTTTTPRVKFYVDTEAPTVTLSQPPRTNNRTPSFKGTAANTTLVTVYIYAAGQQPLAGTCEKPGSPVATATAAGTGKGWTSSAASQALSDGRYVAIAVQTSAFGNHCGETPAAAFTVDTVAPHVAIGYPASGSSSGGESQLLRGSAGTGEGDLPGVTVRVYAGEAIAEGQAPIQSVVVNATGGAWATMIAGLPAGAYTARAEQSDEAGNLGVSASDTFHLIAASAPAGRPVASFSWYPAVPHAGERVSLVSGSTDATSQLTGFAWDIAGNGAFQPAGQVLNTSFATPGNHVVRLRVSDATGASSVATQTIPVGSAKAALMQPFPLVRIVTTRTGSGLKLRLLSILTPPGARVTITCKGRSCPVRRQSKVAAAGKVGLASVSFRRFERVLGSGTTIEIRVSRPGEVGKYTSLSIRRGGVLKRLDTCLDPNGVKPMPCPSS